MGDLPKGPPPVPPRMHYAGGAQIGCATSATGLGTSGPVQNGYSAFVNPQFMYNNQGFNPNLNGFCSATPGNTLFSCAEESFRGSFRNVEAVVAAVASLANMLTSTQNAIYSSIAAGISIADQFSQLKSQIFSLISSSPIIRWIGYLWNKVLVFLRLKSRGTDMETAWSYTNLPSSGSEWLSGKSDSKKPVGFGTLLFWLVAIIGPYFLLKCVIGLVTSFGESRKWAVGEAEHYCAEALFDFNGQNNQELSFRAGDHLRIAPKSQQPSIRGWILASSERDNRIGLVPMNYVKLLRKVCPSQVQNRGPIEDARQDASRLFL